jgi:shikimate dehydrogenase
VVDWASLPAASRAADVVMNATSVGLAGQPPRLEGLAFRAGQVALDMVYGPTAFTREAMAAGAQVVRGEELLVRQGALAFNLWTGRPAPEAVMVAALHPRPEASHR